MFVNLDFSDLLRIFNANNVSTFEVGFLHKKQENPPQSHNPAKVTGQANTKVSLVS